MKKIGITLLILVLLAGALGGVYAISNGFKDWGKLAPKPNDPTQGKVGFTITVGNEDIMINNDTERIEINRNDSWMGKNIKSYENLPNYITDARIEFYYTVSTPGVNNNQYLVIYEGERREYIGFENYENIYGEDESNNYKTDPSIAGPEDVASPIGYLLFSFSFMKNEASYLKVVENKLSPMLSLTYGVGSVNYTIPVYYVE